MTVQLGHVIKSIVGCNGIDCSNSYLWCSSRANLMMSDGGSSSCCYGCTDVYVMLGYVSWMRWKFMVVGSKMVTCIFKMMKANEVYEERKAAYHLSL